MCKKKVPHVQKTYITGSTDNLIIGLKRWEFKEQFAGGPWITEKTEDRVIIQNNFFLQIYDDEGYGHTNPKRVQYHLNAVVCHFGEFDFGHYKCYWKNGQTGRNWLVLDDHRHQFVNENAIYDDMCTNGYLYLYSKDVPTLT